MPSVMDTLEHKVQIFGWQAGWTSRTLPALRYYTFGLALTLCGMLTVLGVRTLIRQRRTFRELEANPSSRAAVLAAHEKQMARSSRHSYFVSMAFALNATVIYFVDTAIGMMAIGHDVAHIPWSTEPAFLLTLGLIFLAAVLLLLTTFVLVPLVQVAFVSWWVARRFPDGARCSLADYVPEARIISTHVAQLWVMLEFFLVAWWPLGYYSIARTMCFMATCGSACVWMDASFAFNFCTASLEEVELTGLSGSLANIVRMCGQKVVAFHSFSKPSELPKYEILAQTEEFSEKAGL